MAIPNVGIVWWVHPGIFVQRVRKALKIKEMIFALLKESERAGAVCNQLAIGKSGRIANRRGHDVSCHYMGERQEIGGSRRVWVEVFGIVKRARRLEALPGQAGVTNGRGRR